MSLFVEFDPAVPTTWKSAAQEEKKAPPAPPASSPLILMDFPSPEAFVDDMATYVESLQRPNLSLDDLYQRDHEGYVDYALTVLHFWSVPEGCNGYVVSEWVCLFFKSLALSSCLTSSSCAEHPQKEATSDVPLRQAT
jgi:hypothetical protein